MGDDLVPVEEMGLDACIAAANQIDEDIQTLRARKREINQRRAELEEEQAAEERANRDGGTPEPINIQASGIDARSQMGQLGGH